MPVVSHHEDLLYICRCAGKELRVTSATTASEAAGFCVEYTLQSAAVKQSACDAIQVIDARCRTDILASGQAEPVLCIE